MVTGADISEGENLYFATATKKAYIKRAGTIVQQAMVEGKIKYSELAGGVHYYCRGAAFSQFGKNRENLQVLVTETNKNMKNKPYIGTFTAGEQGNISGYGIFMGNLTSSMAVFGE
jgi:small ligand-binding sensory domain FIST